MSVKNDDLKPGEPPDRLFYATGVFLDAEDLAAEQAYHRGRLARVLDYLHGDGTAAGLAVSWSPTRDEIHVEPGLAVDRLGRLIEVPRRACLNLGNWFRHHRRLAQAPDGTGASTRFLTSISDPVTVGDVTLRHLVADVYVRFVVCERGRTPAFATGPFDALDATVPSRLRDGWLLSLELRGIDAPLPSARWPEPGADPDAFARAMREQVLQAWRAAPTGNTAIEADDSTINAEDPTSVFLARIRIPLQDGPIPDRRADDTDIHPLVDNHVRRFVWPNGALMRWIEALRGSFSP